MKKQTAQTLLMEYLYNEISPENQEKLETYLDEHPEMLQELKELRTTQSLLKKMPEVEPLKKSVIEPQKRSFSGWLSDAKLLLPRSGRGKAALAAAACVLLILVAGSAANINVHSSENGFTINMGYAEAPEDLLTVKQAEALFADLQTKSQNPEDKQVNIAADTLQAEDTLTEEEAEQFLTIKEAEVLLAKMHQQNKALLTTFAEKMNEQDKQQLQQIVKYFQTQRIYDLKRIKQDLTQVQLAGAYRWQQTNQVLGKIIQTASVNNQ